MRRLYLSHICQSEIQYPSLSLFPHGLAVWTKLGHMCLDSQGRDYKRYVLTGQTLTSCQQLCMDRSNDCHGVHFLPTDSHCHLVVDDSTALTGVGSNIHGPGYTSGGYQNPCTGTWTNGRLCNGNNAVQLSLSSYTEAACQTACAIKANELGKQGCCGLNPDSTPWCIFNVDDLTTASGFVNSHYTTLCSGALSTFPAAGRGPIMMAYGFSSGTINECYKLTAPSSMCLFEEQHAPVQALP